MQQDDYLLEEPEKSNPYEVPFEDFFNTTIEQYDDFDTKAWAKGNGYSCPNFPMFDQKMEGLEKGMYLFAAESNCGKSALMANLLWDYCTNPDNNLFGIYFALDDTREEIIPRIIAMNELIPISVAAKPQRYQNKIDNNEEGSSTYIEWLSKRQHGLDILKSMNKCFKIEDGERIDCGEKVLDYCKKLQDYVKGQDPNANIIVAIDSLFDLRFPSQRFRAGDDKPLNDYIAHEVKRWAKDILEVPIFGSVHLKKIDQKRRPNIADVKESGRYVYEASVVFIAHNDVGRSGQSASIYYTEPDKDEFMPVIELQWAKNKKSSFKGRTYYKFAPNYSKVVECTPEETDRFNSLLYSVR